MKSPHISTVDLLDFLAGRLDAERRAEVHARLAESEEDRARLEALRNLWDGLGQWDVDVLGVDLTAGVMDRIRKDTARTVPLTVSWPKVARVAASWLLAIALGVAVGRTALHYRPTPEKPSEQEVAEALSLGVFGTEGSTGLTKALLEFDEDESQQGGS